MQTIIMVRAGNETTVTTLISEEDDEDLNDEQDDDNTDDESENNLTMTTISTQNVNLKVMNTTKLSTQKSKITINKITTTISKKIEIITTTEKAFILNKLQCPAFQCINTKELPYPGFVNKTILNDPRGKYYHACGKIYFISNFGAPYEEARSYCCNLGMWLISLSTMQLHNCLIHFLKELNFFGEIKTSGYRVGGLAKSIKWCGFYEKDLVYDSTQWLFYEPNNHKNEEKCVVLQVKMFQGLFDTACANSHLFMCENNVKKYIIPPHKPIDKNIALKWANENCPAHDCSKTFNLTKLSSDTEGTIHRICGKLYFRFHKTMDFETARAECCKRGMFLISLETKDETKCIRNVTEIINSNSVWTSAIREPDKYSVPKFYWCDKNVKSVKLGQYCIDEPNNNHGDKNNEWCLLLLFNKEKNPCFADTICDESRNILCEGPEVENDVKKQNFRTCTSTNCPTKECKTKFANMDGLKDLGNINNSNGTNYFFSKKMMSVEEADTFCCDWGMNLLYIDSNEELQIINKIYQTLKRPPHMHWTAGAREIACGGFIWCRINIAIDSWIPWYPGNPQSWEYQEKCLSLHFRLKDDALFSDEICSNLMPFICSKKLN